ncbi:HalOD1 output domain-containing protein [Natrinema amylolyticum]|uniref:HalOD1 output domain-containing protein n=1 Tax=Natrinema amylolyticum TaxID=2878679 RepID=UPI001CFA0B31|nr:HalOD1 output domain-containing protein [Natrinema amylolyticum]
MSNDTAHSSPSPSRPVGDDSSEIRGRFDDGPTTVVLEIVEAVAAVTNQEPDAMSPLYHTIDPEALTDLVTSARDHPIDVSFSYEGCRVTVSSDGCVVVDPPAN